MEDHSGDRKVGILRNLALRTAFFIKNEGFQDRRREGRERISKDPQGPQRGFQKGSQTISKVFINDRFDSVEAQKKVAPDGGMISTTAPLPNMSADSDHRVAGIQNPAPDPPTRRRIWESGAGFANPARDFAFRRPTGIRAR